MVINMLDRTIRIYNKKLKCFEYTYRYRYHPFTYALYNGNVKVDDFDVNTIKKAVENFVKEYIGYYDLGFRNPFYLYDKVDDVYIDITKQVYKELRKVKK